MNDIKSKQRVADHGEVFTPAWMVEAMLDLVKDEADLPLFSDQGKHEIFTPTKTYPPMTMRDLAAAQPMVSDRPTSTGRAAPTAINIKAGGVIL